MVVEGPHATADLPFEKQLLNTRTIPVSSYFDPSEGKFGKHGSPQFAEMCCDCVSRKNRVFRFLAMHSRYMGVIYIYIFMLEGTSEGHLVQPDNQKFINLLIRQENDNCKHEIS